MTTRRARTSNILSPHFLRQMLKRWILKGGQDCGDQHTVCKVSKTDMAGQTLLQHAVAYDMEDHVKVLLAKG